MWGRQFSLTRLPTLLYQCVLSLCLPVNPAFLLISIGLAQLSSSMWETRTLTKSSPVRPPHPHKVTRSSRSPAQVWDQRISDLGAVRGASGRGAEGSLDAFSPWKKAQVLGNGAATKHTHLYLVLQAQCIALLSSFHPARRGKTHMMKDRNLHRAQG